jgi:hypothetical protein
MADRFPGGTFVRHIPHHNTRTRVHQFGSLLHIHCRAELFDGNQPYKAPITVGCSLAHCDVVEGAERVAPQGSPNRDHVISRHADRNVSNQIVIQATTQNVVGFLSGRRVFTDHRAIVAWRWASPYSALSTFTREQMPYSRWSRPSGKSRRSFGFRPGSLVPGARRSAAPQ